MKKLRLVCTLALLLTTLIGCSSNKSLEVTQKARDLQEKSLAQLEDSKDEYNKQVETAKQYELNAVLRVGGKYFWNYSGQSDTGKPSEDETKPLGVYNASYVETKIGTTKSSVQKKIAEYNNKKETDKSTSRRVPMSELDLSKGEKLAISDVSITYYSVTEENMRYVYTDRTKASNKLMQVVTIVSEYGISEYCYYWTDGKVLNAIGFNNL